MSKENLEELSKMSGEDNIKQRPRYVVPIIKLQGKKGVIKKTVLESDGSSKITDIGDSIEGVMLKVRRSFSALTTEGLEVKERLFTNEHNSWRDKVILFQSLRTQKGWKTQMIDEGTIKGLRENYPTLKMRQQIYFLLYPDKEIVKLMVKGKGLSYLFDYWANFASNEHIFQFVSKIGVVQEESPLGPYYAFTFERGDKVEEGDAQLVADNMKEVASNIAKIESYYAEYTPPDAEIEESETLTKEEIPVIEEGEEEIESEDIPF